MQSVVRLYTFALEYIGFLLQETALTCNLNIVYVGTARMIPHILKIFFLKEGELLMIDLKKLKAEIERHETQTNLEMLGTKFERFLYKVSFTSEVTIKHLENDSVVHYDLKIKMRLVGKILYGICMFFDGSFDERSKDFLEVKDLVLRIEDLF